MMPTITPSLPSIQPADNVVRSNEADTDRILAGLPPAPPPSADPRERTLLSRRLFLQAIAAGATVAALPAWMADAAEAAAPIGAGDGVLVLATMMGGNDGLNTFIPVGHGPYHDARGGLAINATRALNLGGGRGLHPELTYFKALWDRGDLAVIDGVGQPGLNLSHFDSMAQVMTSSRASSAQGTGWIGRYLDGLRPDPFNGVSLGSSLPLLVKGRSRQAVGIPEYRGSIFQVGDANSTEARQYRALRAMGMSPTGLGPMADAITAAGRRAVDLAGTVRPLVQDRLSEPTVVTQFRLAARLINANLGIRVITIQFGDFDTHADQVDMHRDRMSELNAGVKTFLETLNPAFATRTLIVGTSEFGRRVGFNGSGTDHGAANSLFAIGHQVKGGIHGQMPSLVNLDQYGNLKSAVEFSHLYGNLVDTWLGGDSAQVLGRDYGDLGFLHPPGKAVAGKSAPVVVTGTDDNVTRRAQVARLYLAMFGNLPDEAGLEHWSNLLIKGGRSLESIGDELARSQQFRNRYGTLTNRQFVELAYRNVMERAPDAKGLNHWLGFLADGGSRGTVMASFSESAEFRNRTTDAIWRLELIGPIGRLYRAYFLRRPDERGLSHWINTGMELPAISDVFANSREFLNRYGTLDNAGFVELVYRNVLGRPAEPKGFDFWVDKANRGTPRGDIMVGFSNSPEFVKKVKALTD